MKRTAVPEVFIGTDLVEVDRVRSSIEKSGDRFLDRIFTKTEQKYCRSKANPDIHFAGRFAAKEACSKALGTGFSRGVYWRDMGVLNLASGKPTMELKGGAARRLAKLVPAGMTAQIDITITDEPPIAQAIVIISAVPAVTN